MNSNGRYTYLVTVMGEAQRKPLAAFTRQEAAQALMGELEPETSPRVERVPLDPEYADDRRTTVDLARDGTHLGTKTQVLTNDCITLGFFQGEKTPWVTFPSGNTRYTHASITMRLETETIDHQAALQQARRVHERATRDGIWPPEDAEAQHMGHASNQLQLIVNQET